MQESCENCNLTIFSFFLEGDDLKTENPRKAIEMFEKVVALETKVGDQVKWFVFLRLLSFLQ
jgi:hypothetical protein